MASRRDHSKEPGLDFLHPAHCAYTDDLVVAASSFRDLTTPLAPAFHSVDHIAGLNLNYRKSLGNIMHGCEGRESLLRWLSDNSDDFREMQVVRYAKYVDTMIGPDGHIHRWTAPRKIIQRVVKINASTKSLVERLCDFKIYAVFVLGYIGLYAHLTKLLSQPRPMPFGVPLQDRTMLYLLAC